MGNNILPQNIYQLMSNYNQTRKNISLMAGIVKHEGSFILAGVYDNLNAVVHLDNNRDFNKNHLFRLLSEKLGNIFL